MQEKGDNMDTKLTVTDASFDAAFEKYKKAEMVMFFATWCPHCHRMIPAADKLAKDYKGKAAVLAVDVDQSPDSSRKFGVSGVPTFVFVKDGKVQETISGEYPEEELRKKLDALL